MVAAPLLLAPVPRRLKRLPGALAFGPRVRLELLVPFDATRARAALRRLWGNRVAVQARAPATRIVVRYAGAAALPQSYRLDTTGDIVAIAAADEPGLLAALQTLAQLLAPDARRLPRVRIADAPDFPIRGFMLDISRDKVPKPAELRRLIDLLAALKFNHLQLYTEHTFAYRRHAVVWKDASPLTAAEVRRLDAYAAARGIELAPNQNSLGHMERWLKHARYAPLAEATGPYRTPWGETRTTRTTLCPTDPRSLRLVRGLYAELLPNFSSRRFNVGCDEPFELGQGRSAAACKRRGKAAVFVDYLRGVHRSVRRLGRQVLLWADVVADNPATLAKLPRDVVLLEWGYEAGHPFARRVRRYRKAGFEAWVCPGTSSWCSFAGRTTNALKNLREAARQGRAAGATGYLVTDWGDYGHRQYWPASLAPLVYAAAAAWNGRGLATLDLETAASRFAFSDRTGRAARPWIALGDLYRLAGGPLRNRTALFRVMQAKAVDRTALAGLTPEALRRTRDALDRINKETKSSIGKDVAARGSRGDRSLIAAEFAATVRILHHAIGRAEWMLGGATNRTHARALALDIRTIMATHARLWRGRNRTGGLRDSLSHYKRLFGEYEQVSARRGHQA